MQSCIIFGSVQNFAIEAHDVILLTSDFISELIGIH